MKRSKFEERCALMTVGSIVLIIIGELMSFSNNVMSFFWAIPFVFLFIWGTGVILFNK